MTCPCAVVGRRVGFLADKTGASGRGNTSGELPLRFSLSFINATTMTKRRSQMKSTGKQHVSLWLALCMIGMVVAASNVIPLAAQEIPGQDQNISLRQITCPRTDLPGCVLMVTNGQNTLSKPIVVQGTNWVDFVCQDTYPPTKDVGVKIPVAPSRQVIAFSCPSDAGTMIMRCEVAPCVIAYIP